MDDELTELLEVGHRLQMTGERRTVVGTLELEERIADAVGVHRFDRHRGSQSRVELPLQHRPRGEQPGVPLPARVDAGEGAVVQLVTEVEGELEVVIGERVGHFLTEGRDRLRRDGVTHGSHRPREQFADQLADRSVRMQSRRSRRLLRGHQGTH
ncbi:MAG TPA: hypothetical protein VFB52_11410 [Solirubrobacterales bacterium]|nr:hypothetical protein [Solirubrobacterales bacterium]